MQPSAQADAWIQFLESPAGQSSSTSASQGPAASPRTSSSSSPSPRASQPDLRRRAGYGSTDSLPDASASSSDAQSRPFTQDQVVGINRILAEKKKNNLYAILLIEKSATEGEIKKAYRKLALKFHPDKCGAPGTDDAFKALSHAFQILSDSNKRHVYDTTGQDGTVRGTGGRGPAGFQGRFEGEMTPEDLFNMFFGGAMGGGGAHPFGAAGGSPFGPTFRTHFVPRNRREQPHPNRASQAGNGNSVLFQFLNLLPILALIIFSLLSNIGLPTTGSGPRLPSYTFHPGGRYTQEHSTLQRAVRFYVEPTAWRKAFPSAKETNRSRLRQWEKDIESDYHHYLQAGCQQERAAKQRKIQSCYGLFGVDRDALEEAKAMRTPSCELLTSHFAK
ncbi:hypothetical protein CXG81DRAFT_13973 [Caulochytrium protostelioides]|uniref:J domain-containing protein n=1 Tax=Caulochytrium protostelioides TaxID=1555241 RepID=A0A4P9X428_9FUNG|nr:hypothetical protein CXG81DRAFT_13973 [Caulochytrium protostelioides]|eukprot:RKO99816.1 hypothetical protein CXG81DRAFT_13973 [Caulochytrium protostelioides]